VIRKDYTFAINTGVGSITFSDAVDITQLGIIVDQTTGAYIYNPLDPVAGGVLAGQVLTLEFPMTGINATDTLQIFYGNNRDNLTLLNTTISSSGQGSSIETTNFGSMTVQLTGNWDGTLFFETSNTGLTGEWETCSAYSENSFNPDSLIPCNGIYSIKRTGKYFRYNCQQISGSAKIVIVGRTGCNVPSPVDVLSYAMDSTLKMPMNVNLLSGLKTDGSAIMESDAPQAYWFNSANANQQLIIDTQGYDTIVIHQLTSGIITITTGNDGVNFPDALNGFSEAAPSTPITTTNGAHVYAYQVVGRYIKLVGPASNVQALIYLRSAPLNVPGNNITAISGTLPVTANVAGMIAVGGNKASGVAPTAFPELVAGIDVTGLTRTILTDIAGRVQSGIFGIDPQGIQRQLGAQFPNIFNGASLSINDTGISSEGFTVYELLAQILLEIRITNQLLYDNAGVVSTGLPLAADDYRNSAKTETTLY